MTGTRQPTIERGLASIEAERELLERERDALERFLARVRDLQVAPAPAARDVGPVRSTPVAADGADGAIAQFREAYRETVMAVSHYEEEYGETLAEHAGAELGETVAVQLVTDAAPPRMVRDSLVTAAEQSRDGRTDLLAMLRRERDSLREIAAELDEIERTAYELGERARSATGTDDLAAVDEELAAAERRCSDLADRRQEQIHERATAPVPGLDGTGLLQYLYGDVDARCPALADIAACLDSVRSHRLRCLQ